MGSKNKLAETNLDYALEYIQRGWHIFPVYYVLENGTCSCGKAKCGRIGKHPATRQGFHEATTDETKIRGWWGEDPKYNIGFCPSKSGLVGTDIDCGLDKSGNQKVGRHTWDALLADSSHKLPDTLVVLSGGGGEHIYFKTTLDVQKSEGRVGKDIDVRGIGGYLILPPSNHVSGNEYRFKDTDRWKAVADLPAWLAKLMAKPSAPSPPLSGQSVAIPLDTGQSENLRDDPGAVLTAKQIAELTGYISLDHRDEWLMFGLVLKTISDWCGGDEAAFQIWDKCCQKWEHYEERSASTQREQWERAFNSQTQYPIGLLKKYAKAGGWAPSDEFQKEDRRWRAEAGRKMLADLPGSAGPDEIEPLLALIAPLPEHHQDPFYKAIKNKLDLNIGGLKKAVAKLKTAYLLDKEGVVDYGVIVAKRVLERHFENGKHLLYAADGFFWKYNGRYWEQIVSEKELGQLCIAATLELGPIPKDVDVVVRQAINNLANLQARSGDPLRLAQPPLSVVNCLNGELWINDDFTVELKNHSPDSFLRFGLNIKYDPSATCPMFDKAVLDIFQDSLDPKDMQRHMMEIYGYAIQPRRFIKIFLLWQGGGDNGKSKLVEVLIELIGKNAVAPGRIQQLGHEYNRANLMGKVVYYDDDLDHNTVLPDGTLKQYSEAKYSSGRHAYGRISEFVFCVLPILLCNNYPITKDLTQGTLTRAHVVPFRHQFLTDVDLDPTLFERIIKDERPGILNQALAGLQRLMARLHFQEPKDCLAAKEEFLKTSNPLPAFLDTEWCIKSVEREIYYAEFEIESAERARDQIKARDVAVATAKAEKEGIEGISQTTQEFYNNFIVRCRNEGNIWKPKKSQVERDLVSLGYPVSNKSGQLRVYRLRTRKIYDQTPERPM